MKYLAKKVIPPAIWSRLSGVRWGINRDLQAWRTMADIVGPAAASIMTAKAPHSFATRRMRRARLKGYPHRIYYRIGTSDVDVMRQVFLEKQYECIGEDPDIRLIIDCGANIGCTSLYFLHHYPKAHVIAVEPDPQNFAVCRRNLQPFGNRVTLVNSGIWSSPLPLIIERGKFSDGREWSFQVRPAAIGEIADLTATTLDGLIERSGYEVVDILKIDIEGSEAELFSEGSERWLPKIRNMVIELHGPECERAFGRAMSGYSWPSTQHGEILFCRNTA